MKYLNQFVTLCSISFLLYFAKSHSIIYAIMLFMIATSYMHPLFTVLSRSYRENWDASINCYQMIFAAIFAVCNMIFILDDSPLRTFYGAGVGLSFIATSYLITLQKK
jgi:hypothetical protein